MSWFLLGLVALIGGYALYGTLVEKVFGINTRRTTPAFSQQDGVDYMPLPRRKVFLIQLLNIAGVGPIFGPILGALYGPAALIWIVLGCIFAGAVHDYFSGMLSVRNGGASVPAITGRYLGKTTQSLMNVFALVVLVLVGVVFVSAPANLLAKLSGMDALFFVVVIFGYYFVATLLPVNKLIGRLYPFFGLLLIFMSVSLPVALYLGGYEMFPGFSAADFGRNLNPNDMPLWPGLFITIACGAVSGFHATQSPLMARCMENEKNGRFVFYGAMIGEGMIALVWCMLALSFFHGIDGLNEALKAGGPANVVFSTSTGLLGAFGGAMAILGVIVLPITSGDTAFRSARLILAELFTFSQQQLPKRLLLAVPVFAIGAILTQVDFGVIWRYFGFANQLTATVMLWTAASYLIGEGKFHWIATAPALFMTAVVTAFILSSATLGFGLAMTTATGIAVLVAPAVLLLVWRHAKNRTGDEDASLASELAG